MLADAYIDEYFQKFMKSKHYASFYDYSFLTERSFNKFDLVINFGMEVLILDHSA